MKLTPRSHIEVSYCTITYALIITNDVDVKIRIAHIVTNLTRMLGVARFGLDDAPDYEHHLHFPRDTTFIRHKASIPQSPDGVIG